MTDETDFTLEDAVDFLTKSGDDAIENRVVRIGGLKQPRDAKETRDLQELVSMILDYHKRGDRTERPLSLAVFGPPGSGKSRAVKELIGHVQGLIASAEAEAGDDHTKTKPRLKKINLTQLRNEEELWNDIDGYLYPDTDSGVARDSLPFIFIDEFDSALGDDPLGWIRQFLAPMQDGVYRVDASTGDDSDGSERSAAREIKRAVLVFAGGTAHTFGEFEGRDDAEFRSHKGPDFVSRLRGTLDIEGINGAYEHRTLRRALVLQHQLGERAEKLKGSGGTLAIDDDVAKALLAVGSYRHGMRSMEALLDMCELTGKSRFTCDDFPAPRLSKLHVSTGVLSDWRVGLSVNESESPGCAQVLKQVGTALLERGAGLAYGGDIKGETLTEIIAVVEQLPRMDFLLGELPTGLRNFRPGVAQWGKAETEDSDGQSRHVKHFTLPNALTEAERNKLGIEDESTPIVPWPDHHEDVPDGPYNPEHHLAFALSLFRMRYRLACEIDALVVVGGKTEAAWGRFPGVIEEAMLALALGKPIFVLGGIENALGGSRDLGQLIGLAEHPYPVPPSIGELPRKHFLADHFLRPWADAFDVSACPRRLPLSHEELVTFLVEHAPASDNGLTLDEQRELFKESRPEACVDLVTRGLERLARERTEGRIVELPRTGREA